VDAALADAGGDVTPCKAYVFSHLQLVRETHRRLSNIGAVVRGGGDEDSGRGEGGEGDGGGGEGRAGGGSSTQS